MNLVIDLASGQARHMCKDVILSWGAVFLLILTLYGSSAVGCSFALVHICDCKIRRLVQPQLSQSLK